MRHKRIYYLNQGIKIDKNPHKKETKSTPIKNPIQNRPSESKQPIL